MDDFSSSDAETIDRQEPPSATGTGRAKELPPSAPIPKRIGRYQVTRLLGEGGSGRVFLAYDEGLQRRVAIKVPQRELVAGAGETERYLAEARILAGLDHPHIVPVYDVGSTDEFPCFIVYKFIEGNDLGETLRQGVPPYHRSARLVSAIADALHCAHRHGLVHRDVKPGNILIDRSGHPFLADFGVAMLDLEAGTGMLWVGTPNYMSPEQASGEIGQMDGRSDIFSLGVVFYQLLTGILPFVARTFEELMEKIISSDVRPPRQRDDRIPRALEKICLRALAKRKSDRYTTARDMLEELEEAMTYDPRPIDVSDVVLPARLGELVERLAKNSHDVWAGRRIAEGWQVGDARDDKRKTHPDLVPYEQMSEAEKDYDRQSVKTVLKAIIALGYQIEGAPPPPVDQPPDSP